MAAPQRVNVIGSEISACDTARALDALAERLEDGAGGYMCFTTAHAAVLGRRHRRFQSIINGSFLSVADGKPLYWIGRSKDHALGHLPGPDFLIEALTRFPGAGHYFYGSSPEVLRRLTASLRRMVPGLRISGSFSPEFRALRAEEKESHYRMIRESGARFIWVGLGVPKQEQWMAEAWSHLRPGILFGVGAAFDFHAGTMPRAPALMRRLGIEWLHRLAHEPRRLAARYLATNTLFLWYAMRDAVTGRR